MDNYSFELDKCIVVTATASSQDVAELRIRSSCVCAELKFLGKNRESSFREAPAMPKTVAWAIDTIDRITGKKKKVDETTEGVDGFAEAINKEVAKL